jgi:hypothetical protein
MAQMATYHELGHSTRLRSIGIDTSFINIGKGAWNVYVEEKQTLTREDVLSDDYFPTLLGDLFMAEPFSISSGMFKLALHITMEKPFKVSEISRRIKTVILILRHG